MFSPFTFVLTCPHCGATKRVGQSFTPKGTPVLWSDGRMEIEGVQLASRTQQCPSCKHFFILSDETTKTTEDGICENRGVLPLQSYKQALAEMKLTEEEENWVRMEAWQAYNKLYNDVGDDDIPTEDYDFNQENMRWLLMHQLSHERNSIMVFEFLRLLGEDDLYRKLLQDFTFEAFVEEEQRDRGIPKKDREADLKKKEKEYRDDYLHYTASRKDWFTKPRRVIKMSI